MNSSQNTLGQLRENKMVYKVGCWHQLQDMRSQSWCHYVAMGALLSVCDKINLAIVDSGE